MCISSIIPLSSLLAALCLFGKRISSLLPQFIDLERVGGLLVQISRLFKLDVVAREPSGGAPELLVGLGH